MKKILNIIFIGLILVMLVPFSVNAGNISTLNVTSKNNNITISGTTESGVLAVAVLVYSNNELVHMDTCSNNNSNKYSCKLNKVFAIGNYTVKVADYNGGNYISKNISISDSGQNSQTTDKEANPKTFDNILIYVGIGSLSVIGLVGAGLYLKKKKFN